MAQTVDFVYGDMKYEFKLNNDNSSLEVVIYNRDNSNIIWTGNFDSYYRKSKLTLKRIFEIAKNLSLGKDDNFKIIFPSTVPIVMRGTSIFISTRIKESSYYFGEIFILFR